jgi:hypothetical protein
MLKQGDLAFFKAMPSIELSPVFIRELRRAMAAAWKKTLMVSKTSTTSASACEHNSRVQSEAQTSRELSQPKRKVEGLSSSDCPSEPTSHRRAPGRTCCPVSQQLGSTEGGLAYAAVVADHTGPQQPSGMHKPQAKGSGLSESTSCFEAALRRMSQGDMSGPLCGMPDGTTSSAHGVNACTPAGQRPNKIPIFITSFNDSHAFLAWLQASWPSDLTLQPKAENLMVVPSTADGFRATFSALWSLDKREGACFHTFSLLEDHCMQLLMKNLGKRMTKSIVREELELLKIHVQGVMQL